MGVCLGFRRGTSRTDHVSSVYPGNQRMPATERRRTSLQDYGLTAKGACEDGGTRDRVPSPKPCGHLGPGAGEIPLGMSLGVLRRSYGYDVTRSTCYGRCCGLAGNGGSLACVVCRVWSKSFSCDSLPQAVVHVWSLPSIQARKGSTDTLV